MKNIKIKKSQLLLFGSFIIIVGIVILSYNKILELKEEVFNEVKLSLMDKKEDKKEEAVELPEVKEIKEEDTSEKKEERHYSYNYIGYLEIPKIRLKRGFLDKGNRYNNVDYNIVFASTSSYPDEEGGNVILSGHSGYGAIAFFDKLNKLKMGDEASITYKGNKYTYKLVKIEEQAKTGQIAIHRPDIYTKSLTLVTCTKGSDESQTIYIFNIV